LWQSFRDDFAAMLRDVLAPAAGMVPSVGGVCPIADDDARFLASVLGPDHVRMPSPEAVDRPSRSAVEDAGPRDPRLAILWSESLVAIGRMLAGDPSSAADERRDAIRLITEIVSDALGSRCAAAWLVDSWLRMDGASLDPTAQSSLRHALRLAEPGSWVERESLLLLVAVGLESPDADPSELARWIERIPVHDPSMALRCAVLVGRSLDPERAAGMVRELLDQSPEMVLDLVSQPRCRPFVEGSKRYLGVLLERTRATLRQRANSVGELHATCNDLALSLGAPFSAISEPLVVDSDKIDLRTGRRLGVALLGEWDATFQEWSDCFQSELSRVRSEATKLEKFLANAYKERDYWAGNVASIEEEARVRGYALHAYGMFGWFQGKRRRQSEQMRAHFEHCRLNLDQAENLLRQQENRAKHDLQNLKARIEQLESGEQRFHQLQRPK
jgi:hypothetical protein